MLWLTPRCTFSTKSLTSTIEIEQKASEVPEIWFSHLGDSPKLEDFSCYHAVVLRSSASLYDYIRTQKKTSCPAVELCRNLHCTTNPHRTLPSTPTVPPLCLPTPTAVFNPRRTDFHLAVRPPWILVPFRPTNDCKEILGPALPTDLYSQKIMNPGLRAGMSSY